MTHRDLRTPAAPQADSETLLRLFVEHAPAAVAVFDREKRCIVASRRWLADVGLAEDDRLPAEWHDAHRRAAAGETLGSDSDPFTHPGGSVRWLSWTARPWTAADGEPGGLLMTAEDVTARVTAEREVGERDSRLRGIFDSTFEYMGLLAPDGRILEVNRAALESIGATREQVIGQVFWDAPWWFGLAHEQAQVRDAVTRATAGEFVRFEARYRPIDGREAYVDFSMTPIRDASGAVVMLTPEGRDITPMKRAEAELRDARARLASALRAGSIATWSWDAASDASFVDERMATLFGIPAEEGLTGTAQSRAFDEIHPEDRHRVEAAFQRSVRTGEPYDTEYRIGSADGGVRWVQSRGEVTFEAGRATGMIGTLLDVTDQKTIESTLREREVMLQAALAVKDEFLGLVSHELRTPMTVIIGMSRVLARSDNDPGRVREIAFDIAESADVLNGLVESMLLLARIDHDEATALREPVVLERLATDVVERFRRRDATRVYELDVAREYSVVEVQPTWLEQVLENLIGNAGKYSQAGQPISIVVDRDGASARVRVLDIGEVLDEAELQQAFDAFYRSAAARERAPGAGLGLAVAKRVIELQGGSIWCRARPDGGAEFGFAIPLSDDG